jgi:hypothetical protein
VARGSPPTRPFANRLQNPFTLWSARRVLSAVSDADAVRLSKIDR